MTRILQFNNVHKSFSQAFTTPTLIQRLTKRKQAKSPRAVLKGVTFNLKAGESVGIIGPNGSGKSTILQLALGIIPPTSGNITKTTSVLPLLSWAGVFIDQLSIYDNLHLYSALLGGSIKSLDTDRVLCLSGLSLKLDEEMRICSPGMKVRLALSIASLHEAGIVLIDEMLSASDAEFRIWAEKLFSSWRAQGKAILHVTHEPQLCERLSTRILSLKDGQLVEATQFPADMKVANEF